MESETLAPTPSDLAPTASESMDVGSPQQMHIESQTQAAQDDKMDNTSHSQVEGAAYVHGSGAEDGEDDEDDGEFLKHNLVVDDDEKNDDEKDDDEKDDDEKDDDERHSCYPL